MKTTFRPDGSIQITIETLEERIILENMYKLKGNGSTLTLVSVDDYLVASPQTIIPPLFNNQTLGSKYGVVFTPEHVKNILEFLTQGSKLGAVKYVKEVTGLGLKEAKDLVDEFPVILNQQELNKQHQKDLDNEKNVIHTHIFTPKEVMVIVGYLDRKERLMAVRYIKEAKGISVETAKIEFDKFLAMNTHIL